MTSGDSIPESVSQDSVLVCEVCSRRHDGAGHVLPPVLRVPVSMLCGRADCAAVAEVLNRAENAAIEAVKAKIWSPIHARRRQAIYDKQHPAPVKQSRGRGGKHAPAPKRDVGSNGGAFRSSCSQELASKPYKDDDGDDQRDAGPNIGAERQLRPTSPGERQEAFVASGKADSANARLIEFFDHCLVSARAGKPISRDFLKGICENDFINNRVDDVRLHYAEKGVKIINSQVPMDGNGPTASHYTLFLMSDEESVVFERTGVPPTE